MRVPPSRGVDHLVAKIHGHVEVGGIPFTDTQIPAQTNWVGATDEFRPEVPRELTGSLGMNGSVGMKSIDNQGDDPDESEREESGLNSPASLSEIAVER